MSIQEILALSMGVCMPFAMDGEGGGEGGDGGGGGAATATDTGGASVPFGQTPPTTGGEGGSAGDSGGQVDLKSLLGEELSGNKSLEKYMGADNPVQELAKGLVHAQSQIGKPTYSPPGEDATDEQKASFREAMGVPAEAKDYEFGKPESWPEGLPYDQEHADAWAQKFHDRGVPKDVANDLRNDFMAEMMEGAAEQEKQANAALNEAFQKQFGDDAGKMSKEVGALMREAIPDDDTRALIDAAIGDEKTPAFGQALGAAIQHLKTKYGLSDTSTGDSGQTSGRTSDDLRDEAQKIMSSEAYRDPMSPGHAKAKADAKALYDQIGDLQKAKQKG